MAARQLRLPIAWKARAAVAGLGLLLAWPPAHHALVERYRLDPWKFFGFAMYCRPTLPVRVEARVLGARGWSDVEPRQMPRGAQMQWVSFVRARATMGDLRTPERLGGLIFRLRPRAREVVFVVTHARLEARSGRIVADAAEYRYERPAGTAR